MRIFPFKGYRYNPKKFSDIKDVFAPPYDVISPREQEALYSKSPYNFVRLDFKKRAGGKNIYETSARELEDWIEEGVFLKDLKDSVYVYVQRYRNLEGKKAKRVGFITLMKIDPRRVKRHERTLSGPKKDRMALMEHLRANMSPIFGFFRDPQRRVHRALVASAQEKPMLDVTLDGVRHILYAEEDPKKILKIARALKSKSMYIADGHHRFEVSLRYSQAHDAPYVMTYLCAAEPNDLTIFPTHRALRLEKGWEKQLENILKKHFIGVRPRVPGPRKMTRTWHPGSDPKSQALGIMTRKGFCLVTPKKKSSDPDVVLADKLLIRPLLQGEDVAHSKRIRYSRDAGEVQRWVKSGEADVGILLAKMPIEDVIRVSDRGLALPQKSTYFYPKLLSGLVFYKFQ